MSWSTTPPAPIIKPGWTTDPTIHIPGGNQQWAVKYTRKPALSAEGTLTADTLARYNRPANLTGNATLTAALTSQIHNRLAELVGVGALSVSALQHFQRLADLAGAGTLSASVIVGYGRAAELAAAGTLSATVLARYARTAILAGGGTLSTTALARYARAGSLSGSGAMSAALTNQIHNANAQLAGLGNLIATAWERYLRAADLAGAGSLSGSVLSRYARNANLTGTGALSATAIPAILRNATLAGSGALSSTVFVPVVFDNATDGGAGATGTRSWSHTNTGNCIVVVFTNTTSSGGTCTYGGVNIPRVYGPTSGGLVFPYTSYTSMFALMSNSLPQGSNTVSVANGNNACAAAAATFRNAGSVGAVSTDNGSGNINKSATNGYGSAAVYGSGAGSNNFGTLSPNQFMNRSFSAFSTWASVAAWAVDDGSGITFSGSHSSTKAGALVPILPN